MGHESWEEREDAHRFTDRDDVSEREEERHHVECVCDDCRPHVRHDATSLTLNVNTNDVTYPCGRPVYVADDDGMTHTGAYDSRYFSCFGCWQAREKRLAENRARAVADRGAAHDIALAVTE